MHDLEGGSDSEAAGRRQRLPPSLHLTVLHMTVLHMTVFHMTEHLTVLHMTYWLEFTVLHMIYSWTNECMIWKGDATRKQLEAKDAEGALNCQKLHASQVT